MKEEITDESYKEITMICNPRPLSLKNNINVFQVFSIDFKSYWQIATAIRFFFFFLDVKLCLLQLCV